MFFGSGKCEMIFPWNFFPAEGFISQAHPLYVRALIIGKVRPFVLVSVEMTSLPDEEISVLRAIAASSAATSPENVWITVTHSFSVPHIRPKVAAATLEERTSRKALQTLVRDAVHTAVLKARGTISETTAELYTGISRIPACRDIELEDGWWVGCSGNGPADPTLSVVRIGGETPAAILLHLNVQPSVLDGTGAENGKCVSGDLAGIACAELEKRYPDTVAVFLIGAAGDQAPVEKAMGLVPDGTGSWTERDLHAEGVVLAERLGRQLAEEAEMIIHSGSGIQLGQDAVLSETTVAVPAKKMNRNLKELKPARNCVWEADGESVQPVSLLNLGDLAIIGVKPELTWATDRAIKHASPYPHTLVTTLVNGGAKYMGDKSVYERCMYEAQNSPFAPGAAEMLADAAISLLKGSEAS